MKKQSGQIGDINIKVIGNNKYRSLKGIPEAKRTPEQKKQIAEYEKQHEITPEQIAKAAAYWDRILTQKEKETRTISALDLWKVFKWKFFEVTGKPFIKSEQTIRNLEPVIYYFSRDERFFKCENVISRLSEPSFDKGLLLAGDFGNGKTIVMRVFEKIFQGTPGFAFKMYTANSVVSLYESCKSDPQKKGFEDQMYNGNKCFDDLKTEDSASNFGKVNVFKKVIEEREYRESLTHGTCNYDEKYPGDIDKAIEEFDKKYGGRVYDRIFKMCNIIEFTGKSLRR